MCVYMQTQNQLQVPVSNWDNGVYDAAFLMALLTDDQQFFDVLTSFVEPYVKADGTNDITCATVILIVAICCDCNP